MPYTAESLRIHLLTPISTPELLDAGLQVAESLADDNPHPAWVKSLVTFDDLGLMQDIVPAKNSGADQVVG